MNDVDEARRRTFGELIRRYRRQAGLTQEELAERAELSPRGLIYLERGERQPQPGTARRLADALELTGEDRSAFLAIHDEEAPSSDGALPGVAVRTFLIADVRGYTRFTQEHGDEAAARLADRFATITRDVVERGGGEVIELRGDEALAVFASSRGALRAATELQDRFRRGTESEPEIPLGVGIGIDAGEAVPVQGGYRGGALNLAARLCSLAQAGEILVSETVVGLTRKVEGLVFLDRGQTQPKGLSHPISIVQIVREDAVPDHVPKFVLQATPTSNLPIQSTPFIGREREVAELVAMLRRQDLRLLTLTGPGGTGKTRLALQAAQEALDRYPDGVFFISLASISDPALVSPAIATTLGVKETRGQPLDETLRAALGSKQLLLVLDNLEHLLEAVPIVGELLAACPRLTILATSQSCLHLAAEREYPVPPLALPAEHPPSTPRERSAPLDLDALSRSDAIVFLLDRARAVQPGFSLSHQNAPSILEICRRLDGLPLAIELAAARIRLFPPEALLARLESRLRLLQGGSKDRPSRHQTLQGAIDWSYGLLSAEEQRLFARLSVFAGGCSLEAAEAICDLDGELDLLDGLQTLVEKSLIRQAGMQEPRFLVLETIREYAAEKLRERGEIEQLKQAHAEYFNTLPGDARPDEGPEQKEWLDRLEAEHDNLRAALGWTLERREAQLGLQLAGRIWRFWEDHGHLSEGRRWLEELLSLDGEADTSTRARALQGVGWLAGLQGQFDHASAALNESLRLSRETGDARRMASVLTSLGALEQIEGNYAEAIVSYEESIALYRKVGDAQGAARPRHNLGSLAYAQGDHRRAQAVFAENVAEMRRVQNTQVLARSLEGLALTLFSQQQYERAQPLLEESLTLARGLGNKRQVASCLHNLGCVLMGQGEDARAGALFEEALALARDMEDSFRITACLESIGTLARDEGELERARKALTEGLETAQRAGYKSFVPGFLEELAGLAVAEGSPVQAATLFAAAEALRVTLGTPRPAEQDERYQAELGKARSQLSEVEWAKAWDDGSTMTLQQAVAYALMNVGSNQPW